MARTRVRWALLCALFCVGVGTGAAYADTISITLSTTISGIDLSTGEVYTNAPLVINQTFTTADFAFCVSIGFCDEGQDFFMDVAGNETIRVNGVLEPYGGVAVEAYPGEVAFVDTTNDQELVAINPLINASFSQSTPLFTGTTIQPTQGAQCFDNPMGPDCPSSFSSIELTSVAATATAEVTVTPDVVTPEPGTWVMVGTGLVGGVGTVRRRWGR